jgi:Protein of unknown function (DUF3102)
MPTSSSRRKPKKPTSSSSRKLERLAARINAAHATREQAWKDNAHRWIDTGRMLCEARAEVHFGGWIDWVDENCKFNRQQANKYVRAYEKRDELETLLSISDGHFTSLEQVLGAISEPWDTISNRGSGDT